MWNYTLHTLHGKLKHMVGTAALLWQMGVPLVGTGC